MIPDPLVERVAALGSRLQAARRVGDGPRLVGRMAIRARLDPSPEAVAAAGAACEGPLADRLARHVRRARGREGAGLDPFATAIADEQPRLAGAVREVAAATRAPAAERDRRLDRATTAAVEAVRDRAATAAASLRGPVTAAYAFGVLLPLALVGVLPAVATTGVPGDVLLTIVVVVYDLLLPAGLVVAAAWILGNRPVAFPRKPVPGTHPARADRPWRALAAGGAAAFLAGVIVLLAPVPGWAAPVAAGGATTLALAVRFGPVVVVRRRAAAMERAIPTALVAVGREVSAGVAVERAIANAGGSLGVPAGPAFESAAERGRRLGCGIEPAFLGTGGPLTDLPSPRCERAVATLARATRAGAPAGDLLVETGDHLAELRRVTERTRRETARLTATLANTAAVFGPLVGGVTVAMAAGTAGRMGATGGGPATVSPAGAAEAGLGTALPVAELGIAVGVYVLLLAAVLTALATGLRYGPDRARIGYRVGLAVPLAAATFCLAVAVAGVVV
ncbi:type II secretion system protein [Haloglomus irregulare]|uniref:Type II secretion system protein n=1 Tax=Haloglomus irregulare TaxID=2234134 RepID=A0A554N7N8_9EURY|nr:type II secretion system protein [Haloglomus irregulare]TSD13416.1 type II secretion system protein [Haloglomus irregulare]